MSLQNSLGPIVAAPLDDLSDKQDATFASTSQNATLDVNDARLLGLNDHSSCPLTCPPPSPIAAPSKLPSCNNLEPVSRQPSHTPVVTSPRRPTSLTSDLNVILDQTGKVFAIISHGGKLHVLAVGDRILNNVIRELALSTGTTLRRSDLADINEGLKARAESADVVTNVWRRIASVPDGIEIDIGDIAHTIFKITANKVTNVTHESNTFFYRPQHARPMAIPSDVGNLNSLKKYVNLDWMQFSLFRGWLSYTLAHPKIPSSKYVILAILGGQGSGKSQLAKIVKSLIDPSVIGAQGLPTNIKELAIAAEHSHVLCYDNLRHLSHNIADALCQAATGSSISSRKLYSDSEQHVSQLHVALVLNGIHAFIDQPDFAQRCLPLNLEPFVPGNRKSESEMLQALAVDLPGIQRGLFDLIAKILLHLPRAKVTNPERMIDFSLWLAAMETADGIQDGAYQTEYSNALNQGQRDALLDNTFAAAILEFGEAQDDDEWFGTPAKLLHQLNSIAGIFTRRAKEWPDNPIALSKRLQSLQAGLLTQGIRVEFSRGKERMITIEKIRGPK